MKIHKPNFEWIKQEAEKATTSDIRRYKWKIGENNLRLLPCWAAHGMLFKDQAFHWQLPPDMEYSYCLTATWPDKSDSCPICDAIDKVLSEFPEVDLSKQTAQKKYMANCIDRDDEGSGVQIVTFTPGTRNWILTEMDNEKIGDVTDINHGVDLKIEFTKGKKIKYTPGWIPRSSALHSDMDIVKEWIDNLYNLDALLQYPDDSRIAEIIDRGDKLIDYYYSKLRRRTKPISKSKYSRTSIKNNEDESDATEVKEEQLKSQTKKTTTKHPPNKQQPKPKQNIKYPPCFSGLESPELHDGDDIPDEIKGTCGFNEDLPKCIICEHELSCIDNQTS